MHIDILYLGDVWKIAQSQIQPLICPMTFFLFLWRRPAADRAEQWDGGEIQPGRRHQNDVSTFFNSDALLQRVADIFPSDTNTTTTSLVKHLLLSQQQLWACNHCVLMTIIIVQFKRKQLDKTNSLVLFFFCLYPCKTFDFPFIFYLPETFNKNWADWKNTGQVLQLWSGG